MGRNLYILAGTLLFFTLVCFAISFSSLAHQPGSPGDSALWRTMGLVLLVLAIVSTIGGMLSAMLDQVERRHEEQRRRNRR